MTSVERSLQVERDYFSLPGVFQLVVESSAAALQGAKRDEPEEAHVAQLSRLDEMSDRQSQPEHDARCADDEVGDSQEGVSSPN